MSELHTEDGGEHVHFWAEGETRPVTGPYETHMSKLIVAAVLILLALAVYAVVK